MRIGSRSGERLNTCKDALHQEPRALTFFAPGSRSFSIASEEQKPPHESQKHSRRKSRRSVRTLIYILMTSALCQGRRCSRLGRRPTEAGINLLLPHSDTQHSRSPSHDPEAILHVKPLRSPTKPQTRNSPQPESKPAP